MDTVVTQLARDLAQAIAAAVADDARVEAIREKARAAGFDMKVSLDAVVGFASRDGAGAAAKTPGGRKPARQPADMTATDRRFLKSLRIAADETTEKEVD